MHICPCCGTKLTGDLLTEGCGACGARAVGPPLARPAHELPVYGRALALGAAGALLLLIFLANTGVALSERPPLSFDFWSLVAAGETAAWRLKFVALPLAAFVGWCGWRGCAALRREPQRFGGLRLARMGFASAVLVAVVVVTLIGVTVPERLRQRELAAQAAQNAVAYDVSRVLLAYQTRYGSYPTSAADLRAKMPDTDGAVARVAQLIATGTYEPESAIASLPAGPKTRPRRDAAAQLRPAALRTNVDDAPDEGLSFTNYKLVLPGRDHKLGTPDDITLRDGVLVPTLPPVKSLRAAAAAAATGPTGNTP